MTTTRAWWRWAAGVALAAGTLGAAPQPPTSTPPPVAAPAPAKDEIGTVEGIEIARPGGGFLGLQVVNNNFVLTFYTAKKQKTEPDVVRASVRWAVKYQPNDERVILSAGADGKSLSSERTVRPPHVFKVHLNLLAEGQDDAVESYVVDYRD